MERKNLAPTDKWDDLKWGEHAHAFTVAHSVEADILNTLHGLMKDAIKNGEAYESWRNKALELMKASGWYGGNGHTAGDKKYISWRLRIIYDTNMRISYSAAQYRKQLQDVEGRPIWVYKSKLTGKNRRQEHIALHDTAFWYDDPFWEIYYPPNGWGCQCWVTTKSVSGAKRDGIEPLRSGPSGEPPEIKDTQGNPLDWSSFGDPTWKYNAGREAKARYHRDMNQTRLTEGEFKVLIRRAQEADYKPSNILYQVGN
ncbi:MAG: phage head morphogenesis protein, partial [Treponema sp.]|nr:phage head morphogenesis protein [Treponema sp.]